MILSGGWWSIYSGSYSVTQNQYYKVHMTYYQYGGPSTFVMNWWYSGQSSIVVPSSYLYFPTYVSNSPFNVTVTCPPDYIQTVSGSTPDCVYLCGNSKRDSTEECDDGNATSGDGWSATWDVENGYVCTGGSSTTVDTCSKFTFVVSSSTPSISTTTSTSSTASASTSTPTPATTSSPSKPSVYI